ncbi:hypothetical protein C8R41DRAFT_866040 [Lentinula lateritia]|uniref:Glycosyltransferase family 90 protein n=1 Tax=Lentinula lateritia TaxID=40482 RepID=A0ABQ8VJR2_9AGAR|nr:hypothetical protein C8R41DRAFT_866040 [Lentinula lateritia]
MATFRQWTLVYIRTCLGTPLHRNIRFPTPYGWVEDVLPRLDDPDFADKTEERLPWRIPSSHRNTLVRTVNEVHGTLDFLVPPNLGYKDQPVDNPKTARRARLNPAMMEAAFVREPSQCDEPTCSQMKQLYEYKDMQRMKDAGNHKYVLDVDLLDLYDSLIFFRGDSNGEGAQEELERQIALQGREWSKTYWRRQDIIAYSYRMFLEYARIMSLDRENDLPKRGRNIL